ncbi:MAG: class I SAM-dependent methyltransferase [Bacteroidota bacterium]
MLEADQNNIAIFEGNRAKNYDHFVDQWIPNYDYFMGLLPKILDDVTNKKTLVVGCGTGNEILSLASSSNDWSFTGVDPSPEMIAIAKEKLDAYQNVEFFQGVLEDLKKPLFFGAATLLLVLHFVKYPNEKLQLLKEIEKRLISGAPLIILGIFGTGKQLRANLKILRHMVPDSVGEKEIEERFDRIKNLLHRSTEEELTKLLFRAGFEPPTRFFQASIYSGWITRKL